jgi:hypothetical protein
VHLHSEFVLAELSTAGALRVRLSPFIPAAFFLPDVFLHCGSVQKPSSLTALVLASHHSRLQCTLALACSGVSRIFGDLNKHHVIWTGPNFPHRTARSDASAPINMMALNDLEQLVNPHLLLRPVFASKERLAD